jgi:transposase
MTQSYSLDLRVRVVAFVEAGHSCRAAARHFGVSDSFAIKLLQRQRRSGSPAPARHGRPPGHRRLSPYETFLIQAVETKPAITMPELAARLLEEHGVVAAPAALSRSNGHSDESIPGPGEVVAACPRHPAAQVQRVGLGHRSSPPKRAKMSESRSRHAA